MREFRDLSGTMGRVVGSVACGYAGAVLAGLVVAIVGVAFGLNEETVLAAAAPTGIIFGVLGLSLMWWRPVVARLTRPRRMSRRR